jgi:phosphatidylserine/phosphatidylglycerophosphate/cardiolipin synthase-like enzyme
MLVYGLLNTNQAGDLQVLNRGAAGTRVFVLPEWIKQLNGVAYDASRGQGNQIHVKSLVVDPWSAHPSVLLGSANFSDESVTQNDENALLIEGDGWAAAQVATEFLRVFEHYRFRNRIGELAQAYDTQQPPASPAGTLGPEDVGGGEGTIWLVGPDDPLVEAGNEAAAAVLGVTITNLWLDESDAWLARYYVDGSPQQRERAVFAA